MTEQIKKINNPLTIIAIFAALAEVNATIAIGLIDNSLHDIFIWFIIGFPTLLVVLFFLTLNYNTKVMYSPSDYREDKTFLDSLYGQAAKRQITKPAGTDNFTKVINELEEKLVKAIDTRLSIKTAQTVSGEEIKMILHEYKTEIKKLSEKALKETETINFYIPQPLRSAVLEWVSYPAFLPIIYAIVMESCKSVDELKKFEDKYHLPAEWDEAGVNGLFSNEILRGTQKQFSVNGDIVDVLNKWINVNKETIVQIVDSYAQHEKTGASRNENARNFANKLLI